MAHMADIGLGAPLDSNFCPLSIFFDQSCYPVPSPVTWDGSHAKETASVELNFVSNHARK